MSKSTFMAAAEAAEMGVGFRTDPLLGGREAPRLDTKSHEPGRLLAAQMGPSSCVSDVSDTRIAEEDSKPERADGAEPPELILPGNQLTRAVSADNLCKASVGSTQDPRWVR